MSFDINNGYGDVRCCVTLALRSVIMLLRCCFATLFSRIRAEYAGYAMSHTPL